MDVSDMSHVKDGPVLNVDDDHLYEEHKEGEGVGSPGEGGNINRFRNRVIAESATDEEESSEDVSQCGIVV